MGEGHQKKAAVSSAARTHYVRPGHSLWLVHQGGVYTSFIKKQPERPEDLPLIGHPYLTTCRGVYIIYRESGYPLADFNWITSEGLGCCFVNGHLVLC